MQNEGRLQSVERATEIPLLVLATAMIPLLLIPYVVNLSDGTQLAFLVADWFIWAAFAADFGVKLAVAPRRLEYVRRHPLEAAMVFLPFLRPLRLARFLRLARVATALGVNVQIIRNLASQKGPRLIAAAVLLCLVFGAAAVFLAERRADESNITSFGDSLWWAATTMTTVGYGDRYPTTPEGRGVAVVLMFFGIATLSALTAVVAATLVQEQQQIVDPRLDQLLDEVRSLRSEVAELHRSVSNEPKS
jgi:voltage-gated potassium channel